MECGVCLDTKTDTEFTILPCTHKVCSECFPKIKIPKCPFCRAKYGNDNNKYYDEIDDDMFEIELDFDMLYYSDGDYQTSRIHRRRRRRRYRNENIRPRPRQITPSIPVNIFVIQEGEREVNDTNNNERINIKKKRKFKNNEKRRNKVNNSWNYRRIQTNISQSY